MIQIFLILTWGVLNYFEFIGGNRLSLTFSSSTVK